MDTVKNKGGRPRRSANGIDLAEEIGSVLVAIDAAKIAGNTAKIRDLRTKLCRLRKRYRDEYEAK